MRLQRRRRQVRPLTIYGYRRGRSKAPRLWLALLVLASLSVLPRVLSPIAEKLWGEPTRQAAPVASAVPQPPAAPVAGNAFAAPEPEPQPEPRIPPALPPVARDSLSASAPLVGSPAPTAQASKASAPQTRARVHRTPRTAAETKEQSAPAPKPPRPRRLVAPSQ